MAPQRYSEQLQRPYRGVESEKQAAHEKIEEYEQAIHALRRRKSDLDREMRLEILRDFLRQCRALARKVQECLPPELRNTVYEHAWKLMLGRNKDKESYIAIYDTLDKPWLLRCDGKRCTCFDRHQLPVWTLPHFVGYDVAKEAALVYYRFMYPGTLKMDVHNLSIFLTRDHLHLGLTPADHIREFTLRIFPNHCHTIGDSHSGSRNITAKGFRTLKMNFEALRQLRLKNGFRLTVLLGWIVKGAQILHVLQVLYPIYEELKDAGAVVKIQGVPGKELVWEQLTELYETYGEWALKENVPGALDFQPTEETRDDTDLMRVLRKRKTGSKLKLKSKPRPKKSAGRSSATR